MSANQEIILALKEEFIEGIIHAVDERERRAAVTVKKEILIDVCRFLKDRLLFDHLTSIASVDRSNLVMGMREKQLLYYNDFEVVYHVWSHQRKTLVEVKTVVPRDSPALPTVTGIWGTANWQ